MKICAVVGARPQFIKAAVVSRALAGVADAEEQLVHTGQHYDDNMSRVFFEELQIPKPDYHLGIGSGPHGQQTGRMLEAVEGLLLNERPDWVLVYGDTNSTLAGALAAGKLHVPVAHVEAGLRSFNRRMPEEINRVLTDHVAEVLFAPTEAAGDNLIKEGISSAKIDKCGDVMFDASVFYGELAERTSGVMSRLKLAPNGYILATMHRAENTDDRARLLNILQGLALASREIPVVLPLHPRTKSIVSNDTALAASVKALRVVEPFGYLDMVVLEKHARVIATDSGGVQKEAYFHGVPCVTLRDETEWVELVQSGWNRLARPDDAQAVADALMTAEVPSKPQNEGLFGDGRAAERIVKRLLDGPSV